jgi:type VI protein secretion system component Hcp
MSEKANAALNLDAETRVLRDDELDAVSGGKVSLSDIVITKPVDVSTPKLFVAQG